MMTRAERAKQFKSFDAMKGLQEALRDREVRHLRVEKHGVSEEDAERNSRVILKLERGMTVDVAYYKDFHDVEIRGKVTFVDLVYRKLKVDEERILFDDIYSIRITDV